jgi:hypothetical protein
MHCRRKQLMCKPLQRAAQHQIDEADEKKGLRRIDHQPVVERVREECEFPIYKLGIAPGSNINTLADLKGKKNAYSPGQAQGALVLRILQKAGYACKPVLLLSNRDAA